MCSGHGWPLDLWFGCGVMGAGESCFGQKICSSQAGVVVPVVGAGGGFAVDFFGGVGAAIAAVGWGDGGHVVSVADVLGV